MNLIIMGALRSFLRSLTSKSDLSEIFQHERGRNKERSQLEVCLLCRLHLVLALWVHAVHQGSANDTAGTQCSALPVSVYSFVGTTHAYLLLYCLWMLRSYNRDCTFANLCCSLAISLPHPQGHLSASYTPRVLPLSAWGSSGCRDAPDFICDMQKCHGINVSGSPLPEEGCELVQGDPSILASCWDNLKIFYLVSSGSLGSPVAGCCLCWCPSFLSHVPSLIGQKTEIPLVMLTERTKHKAL